MNLLKRGIGLGSLLPTGIRNNYHRLDFLKMLHLKYLEGNIIMKIPVQKLKAMIRFFATYTNPALLGKKKLMKLFYFSDFTHVKRYASPITFDRYINMEHGPIPSTILNLINSVENDTDDAFLADSLVVEIKVGTNIKRIVPNAQFSENDRKYFTASEIKVMENVCDRFKDKNGKFIEDKSHEESAWKSTTELEYIPYTLAVNDPDCLTEKEEIELALSVMG